MNRQWSKRLCAALAVCLAVCAFGFVLAEGAAPAEPIVPEDMYEVIEPPVAEAQGDALRIGGLSEAPLERESEEKPLVVETVSEKPYAYAWTVKPRNDVYGDGFEADVALYQLSRGEAVLMTQRGDGWARIAFNTPEGVAEGRMALSCLEYMTEAETDNLLDEMSAMGAVALYENDVNWPIPMAVKGLPLAAADFTALSNDTPYMVQGKTIRASMVGNYSDCWSWARALYNIIWGVKFTSDWEGNDATGLNLIRNLTTDEERLLTGENLKRFIGQSALGCTLRICSCPLSCPNIDKDGCSKHEKHSLIVVDKDADGMVVMDNMTGSGSVKYTTRYYTWDGFARHWAKYKMVKYIKWPHAPEYAKPGGVAPVTPEPESAAAAESIRLNASTLQLTVGQSHRLTATVLPANAADADVAWSSSDPFVAYVNQDGTVVPVASGSAVITARTAGGLEVSASVRVTQSAVQPTRVALSATGTVTLGVGETLRLEVILSPAGASAALEWKSSKAKVATVSGDGLVTAVSKGSCTVGVRTANGKSASVKIKVVNPAAPTKVALDRTGTVTLDASLGQTLQLNARVTPATASTKLTWKSSSTKVARVSGDGLVTPVGKGSCTVTVKTANGKSAKVKIKVTAPTAPTKVKLNKSGTVSLAVGDTLQLTATLSPSSARSELLWKSTDEDVARISADGRVTAVAAGTCTVGVITANQKTATLKVSVTDPNTVSKVRLNKSGTVTLKPGKTLQLACAFQPATATTPYVWKSTNERVASIDASGRVTARQTGTATVGVLTANGKYATVKIRVKK